MSPKRKEGAYGQLTFDEYGPIKEPSPKRTEYMSLEDYFDEFGNTPGSESIWRGFQKDD